MLDADELGRRIKAARMLRHLGQTDLDELFAQDGLGTTTAGRVERGDLTMLPAHRWGFARHLRVPEAWLTDPNADHIIDPRGDPSQLDRIEIRQAKILAKLDEVLSHLEGPGDEALPAPPEPGPIPPHGRGGLRPTGTDSP